MKFLLYLCICIIISLTACNSASSKFILDGFTEGSEDFEVVLCYLSLKNDEWHEISDTIKTVNGKFSFEGNIDELTAAELCWNDSFITRSIRVYLEPVAMRLQFNKNEPYTYKLSGTKVEKENIVLRTDLKFSEKIAYEHGTYINDMIKQIELHNNNSLVRDSLINILNQNIATWPFKQEISKKHLNFILKYKNCQIVPDLLYLLAKQDLISIDSTKSLYNTLPEQSKSSLLGKLACKQIEYQENIQKRKENTSVGCAAPDFTRKDSFGKMVKLSEFKNKKFILLDFWASWCSPCLKEIPKIKKLYDKYNEKEFSIIGISLDTDSNSWIHAINKYKLDEWPQILSNRNGRQSVFNKEDISDVYNLENGIPYYVLIDKQGKIIARWEYIDEKQLIEIDKLLK